MYDPNLTPPVAQTLSRALMSDDDFIRLGAGQVAYIRRVGPHELGTLFPRVPAITGHSMLFALYGADGAPLMLADTRDALMANAMANDLETVATH